MKKFAAAIIILLIICFPSVSKALILGPYTGIVIDSRTGEPVEGASVLIYWSKPVFQAIEYSTELIKAELIYTDKQGRYEIPKMLTNIGLLGTLDSTNIIIYQPGYQVYTARVLHDSPYEKPDNSFKEKDNIVKLDRIPPNFSYRKHYEKIEGALRGIREYSRGDSTHFEVDITWEKAIKMNLRGVPEREELLRRAEWEERRGRLEKR